MGISNGMRFLHSLGLIHRDLKCANILLTSDLDAKITDFGTTRVVPRDKKLLMTGGMGTLEYMAPEILSHQIYTKKADVFSFAIVLWQMISRKEPYEDLSIFTIPEHVCKGSRPPIPAECPHKLAHLIKSCWSAKQAARPEFAEICRMLQVIAGLSPDTSSATAEYFRKCGVLPPGISATTVTELQAGSVLLKCGRSGKPHFSLFQLSDDSTYIQWTSRTKDPSESRIAINSVREMCIGQLTPVFARSNMEAYAHLSFSIISPDRSVDIICTTSDEFNTWTAGLRTLLPISSRVRTASESSTDKVPEPSSPSQPSAAPAPSQSSTSGNPVCSDAPKATPGSPPLAAATAATVTTTSSSSSSSSSSSTSTAAAAVAAANAEANAKIGLLPPRRRRSLSVGSGQQLFMNPWPERQRGHKFGTVEKIKATRCEKSVNVYSANMEKVPLEKGGYAPMTLSLVPEMLGKDISQVSAGKLHYAAVSIHGALYMWGDNTFGQQGVPPERPRTMSSPAMSIEAKGLQEGHQKKLQQQSQQPPSNNDQKLSSQKRVFSNIVSPLFVRETLEPHSISLGTAIVQSVACGKNHTLCLTADGTVYSWGKNAKGELGLGDNAERYVPTVVEALNKTSVIIIACGQNTSAAYTDDGVLYMWGQNDTSQLAQDGPSHITLPSPVPYDLSTPTQCQVEQSESTQNGPNGYMSDDIDEQSSSSSSSSSAQSLAVFRKNVQLAKRIKKSAVQKKSTENDDDSIIEQIEEIALGQYHSAALTSKKKTYNIHIHTLTLSLRVSFIHSFTYFNINLALGTIWVWGKLGNTISKEPRITKLPNGIGGVQISSGDYHMAAIGDDEQIYTWGDGNLGQLGRGISEFSPNPRPVIGPFSRMKPQQVFCSGSYTAVVTEEGHVYAFGYGSAGRWNTTEESLPNLLTAFKSKNVLRLGCGPNQMLAIVTQRDTPDRRLTGWIPDNEAKCCMACKEPFTAIRRRHHCRKCEGIYCGSCSRYRTPILSKGFTKPVRVCLNCYAILTTLMSKT